MKQIGQGSFTTAYLNEAGNVILHSIDPIRKIMAKREFENDFFPRVYHLGTQEDYEIYGMKYLTILHDNYTLMNEHSRRFWERFKYECIEGGYREILGFIKREMKDFPEEQKAFLQALRCFWGSGIDLCMEFYEMNIAVDKETGNLIFFDMFLDNKLMNKLY